MKTNLKVGYAIIISIVVSLALFGIFWVAVRTSLIEFSYAFPLLFVSYLIYYMVWINPLRSFWYNYLIPCLFWFFLLFACLYLNFKGTVNYFIIVPYIFAASLSFWIAHLYKRNYKKTAYSILGTSMIMVISYGFYFFPMYIFYRAELTAKGAQFAMFQNQKIRLIDSKGNDFDLSKISSKVVFLEFGFSNCLACFEKQPVLKKLRNVYKGNKDITFIKIVSGAADNFSIFQASAKAHGPDFDLYLYAPKESIMKVCDYLNIGGFPYEKVYLNGEPILTHAGFSKTEANYYYTTRVKKLNEILNE